MSLKYTKLNANDYEDGIIIFKKVTDGEDHLFQRMTAAELQTELGAIDPNNYDAGTFLFIEDDGSGTNNIVSPQSVAEVKSLLGMDSQFKTYYKALILVKGTSTPIISDEYINLMGESPSPSYVGTGRHKLTFTNNLTGFAIRNHLSSWDKIIDLDDFSFYNLQWGLALNYVQTNIRTDAYAYKNPVESEILVEIGKYE